MALKDMRLGIELTCTSLHKGKESQAGLVPRGPTHAHSIVSWLCGIFVANTADWAGFAGFADL
jgi:hypothetical protein